MLIVAAPAQAAVDLGFAKEDGGQPGAFLDFSASARSVGMGGAHVAVADDATASYWNPAGLAQVSRKEVVADYSALWEDTSFGTLSYAHPTVDFGVFGFGMVSLRSSDYEKRTAALEKVGSFSSSELGLLFSNGIDIRDRLALGFTAKVIQEKVDTYSSTGYGLDGGAMFRVSDRIQTGLTIRNILAPRLKLKAESDVYPLDVRAGVQAQVLKKLMLAFDINQTQKRSLKLHLGSEYVFNELIALRAGLNESEISAGLGLKFKNWGIDYAFGYQDAVGGVEDLGSSHRFGFRVSFGKPVFEEEASVRWQKKGQDCLEALAAAMDEPGPLSQSEMDKLITVTEQVIRRQGYLKPQHLYAAQGYVYYFRGQYERGVQALGEAAMLDPVNTQLTAHLQKARTQMTEERTREIVTTELKRIRDLADRGDWRGVLKSCEKILRFRPDSVDAAAFMADARAHIQEPILREMKIAKAKLERGEYLDAIKSFQNVKEMDPENKEASALIAQAIEALEKQATLQAEAGQIQVPELGKTAERPVYETGRNAEQSRALYSKGLSLYSEGRLLEAAAAWEQALRFDVDNALARNAYTRAQNELKENP